MGEKFRVLRHESDGGLIYVGTYVGDTVKKAIRLAAADDARRGNPGDHRYEAHVVRNASIWDASTRNEQFIDKLTQ